MATLTRMCAHLKFEKGESVRFISHLDLLRTLERALRRAMVPLAFTQGYSPRPRMTFASALPVGATGAAEMVSVDLEEPMAPLDLARGLNQALPEGLSVVEVEIGRRDKVSPYAKLREAEYWADLESEASEAEIEQALAELLPKTRLPFQRRTKRGVREVDLRPGMFFVGVREPYRPSEANVGLEMLLGIEETKLVKPEEVVAVLAETTGKRIELAGLHRVRLA